MAKICFVCGSEMQENDKFCNYCGTPDQPAAPAAQPEAPVVNQVYTQQPEAPVTNQVYTQQPVPPVNYAYTQQPVSYPYPPVAPQPETPKAGLSVGAFFGFNILFNIPFIGFILIIIMSFAPRNKTLKNFARSYLLFYIIAIAIVLILVVLSLVLGFSLAGEFEDIIYSVM